MCRNNDTPESCNNNTFDDSISGLMIVDERVICSLRQLLEWKESNIQIYADERDHFRNALRENGVTKTSSDLLSSAPLEAAYVWTLSCHSAPKGSLRINEERYDIQRKSIELQMTRYQKLDAPHKNNCPTKSRLTHRVTAVRRYLRKMVFLVLCSLRRSSPTPRMS